MENKKSMFNDFIKSLFVIIMAIVLVLSGYAARKYFDVRKENKKDDTKVVEKDTTSTKTADELYKDYIANLKENISNNLTKNTSMQYRGEDLGTNVDYYIELTHDYELYLHGAADTEFEISKDVVQAFLVESGNGGTGVIYFVKTDGNLYVSYPSQIFNQEEASVKKTDYKNIVNVVSGNFSDAESGYHDPIFVDIEGNIIK